jgi:hypothetical protein
MHTDGDLDAGLVELDSCGPGDEAGTEKQDFVRGHDCGDVLFVCLWGGWESEARNGKVKTTLPRYQDPSDPPMAHKTHGLHAARQPHSRHCNAVIGLADCGPTTTGETLASPQQHLHPQATKSFCQASSILQLAS